MPLLDKLHRFTASHGALRAGRGLITGSIALGLAVLCLLGVLAFHFPEYLTTPQLRKTTTCADARGAVRVDGAGRCAMRCSTSRSAAHAGCRARAFALVVLAALLGGHKVPVGNFADGTPYIGLDWFILDLLGSTLIFVFIEKLFPLRRDSRCSAPSGRPTCSISSSTTC